MEVLDIDESIASRLSSFYWQDSNGQLEEVEGVTAELIDRIKTLFK